ncbi:EAL domain-containing protein [Siculibacillus lacustris]|uniref:cyclic-guanylate-specific phosphodiesterase n=1 Tax=Siculibacillus lacustris TaxID=1549641 RepID=A0A4V2KTX6_9HYPH|nr:EAL domain-containing protein [Siculibacillus lacustris]TBW39050.1 EAL domain-containing protein [Siculibacillus lacustris]
MRKRNTHLALAIVMVVLIGAAPLLVGRAILQGFAEKVGRADLRSLATRQLERAEAALAETVTVLRTADRAGLTACSPNELGLLGEAAAKSRHLRRIGLVDRDGYAMCFDPPTSVRRGAMLILADKSAQVTVSMLDQDTVVDGRPSGGTAVVAWRTASGNRLVGELTASVLDLDGGADYLRGARAVTVTLDGGHVWSSQGRRPAGDEVVTSEIRSALFPVSVTVESSLTALRALVQPLEITLAIGSLASMVVLFAIAVWIFWKPSSEVDDELSIALQRQEFVPYFQPVMNIDTGRIEGCEMLVRWIRADGSMVSPGAFMSYCETSGHVFEMTRQLMRRSVADLGRLYTDNRELKLSINLFAGHFADRRIVEDIIAIFENGPIAYDQLVFEVTERYPLGDIVQARRIIAEMHALGCRVALDDTGTGHGGLAYIQQLGIDIVKIDKMFVDAMGTDLGASTIVDVLVELANSLGMGVVAEGVETQEQLERLREKGVTSAQGYVFAPALPAKLFIDLAENILHPRHPEAAPTDGAEPSDLDAAA